MIDQSEAVEHAHAYLARMDGSFVLLEEQTREEPFGWVFFYGQSSEIVAGNAPFVVLRDTGAVEVTGTARPLDEYLASIRAAWEQRQA